MAEVTREESRRELSRTRQQVPLAVCWLERTLLSCCFLEPLVGWGLEDRLDKTVHSAGALASVLLGT